MAQDEQIEHKENQTKNTSMGKLIILGGFGGIIVALFIIAGIGYTLAKKGSTSQFSLITAEILRLPVAKVNGQKILYTDYREDIGTLKKFYAASSSEQPVPTDDQLSEQVLSRYMVNAIMSQVADEFQVSVKDADIGAAQQKMVSQFPSEAAANKELEEKYGWTMNEYLEKVIRPVLLEQAVAVAFEENNKDEFKKYEAGDEVRGSHILLQVEDEKTKKEVKKLAEEILKKIQDGENFESLAKQYGSDGTKESGGDLGWFSAGAMVKPFEDAMFALKDGELAPTLVETEFGFHIIKRTGTRKAKDFNTFMKDRIISATIVMYMNVPNPLTNLTTPT